jgi:hypothetical protein
VAAFAVCLGMYAMLLVEASIRHCGHTRIEKATDLTESASSCSRMRTTGRVEAFYAMLRTAPKPGTDALLGTHKPNVIDAPGRDWSGVGEASPFCRERSNYKLVPG